MLLVDTNVLIDVFERDPDWSEWSMRRLRALAQLHQLAIDPIVYAELSAGFLGPGELDTALEEIGIELVAAPRPALFLAGRAFLAYRRRGGSKNRVLADFLIGAHAAVRDCPILTRDTRHYREYFPSLHLIAPESDL
ncbi:MAG TPA: PIN domain-containing protein [Rudaea sp.]|nr:PIN domain-containing protein [Rudaea sp.]